MGFNLKLVSLAAWVDSGIKPRKKSSPSNEINS